MNFKNRAIAAAFFASAFASAYAGSAQGFASATVSDWVSDAGPDISYSTSFNLAGANPGPFSNYGPGYNSTSVNVGTLGNPFSASSAIASGIAAAGVSADSSDFWVFTNAGSSAESVTVNYTAHLFASNLVSDLVSQTANAYAYVGTANSIDNWSDFYDFGTVSSLPQNASGSWNGNGLVTFSIGAQQSADVMIQSGTGVQVTSAVPEPAPIAALGVGALGLMLRKRRVR